jgi:hypothetical protein
MWTTDFLTQFPTSGHSIKSMLYMCNDLNPAAASSNIVQVMYAVVGYSFHTHGSGLKPEFCM